MNYSEIFIVIDLKTIIEISSQIELYYKIIEKIHN